MKKLLTLFLSCALFSGCTFLHIRKMDIEQGNSYTQADVSRLHRGMSMSDVKNIMGHPILINELADNRLDYVYTNQPGLEDLSEKRVTCIFQRGRLIKIEQI